MRHDQLRRPSTVQNGAAKATTQWFSDLFARPSIINHWLQTCALSKSVDINNLERAIDIVFYSQE